MTARQEARVWKALDSFELETPTWGLSDEDGTIDEVLSDAGQVHQFSGCCPTVALQWPRDFSQGQGRGGWKVAGSFGVRPGSIQWRHGSLASPDPEVRAGALQDVLGCIEVGRKAGIRDICIHFVGGSIPPGTNIRYRRQWLEEGLQEAHANLIQGERLLIEHGTADQASDIADWGMALLLARAAGPQAKVLVDGDDHQLVAWLLDEGMLAGLQLRDINPYETFCIFHEIRLYEWETGRRPGVVFRTAPGRQGIEHMIQASMAAQELYGKAALVDCEDLAQFQERGALIDAEEHLKTAFAEEVRPAVCAWRRFKQLPEDPLSAFRVSGYLGRVVQARSQRKKWRAMASHA